MLVHEPSGGRERVEAVDVDGERPELVDLVQVLRLPERVTNQSRAAIER